MATGLSVNRVINVQVNLAPKAAPRRSFGVLCIAGDTDVIDGQERLRPRCRNRCAGAPVRR